MSSRYKVLPTFKNESNSAPNEYWKPGAAAPGTDILQTEENFFVYNPKAHLAINSQKRLLPIANRRNELLYAVETHSVTIVVGETGSGKTTQIPQFLDEAGWTAGNRSIVVTQPRRIAAIKIAERVAEEMGSEVGEAVGYSVRFESCFDPVKSRIKFVTDGTLVRELMDDPLLGAYSVVVLDEVHERSVATDLLLGLLKKIMRKRRDLRLIVSSATLDATAIKEFFDRALMLGKFSKEKAFKEKSALLFVEGKTFPVDTFYLESPTKSYTETVIKLVKQINYNEREGDILVFLTGEEEVDSVCAILREESMSEEANLGSKNKKPLIVLPLYSSLSSKQQLKCFQKSAMNTRKVIVCTNMAETSVTIPGIVYVIDALYAKINIFDPDLSLNCLTSVPISKASAEQRKGRAGRMAPGKCFRLCTEKDFALLQKENVPEIQRTKMTEPILQLKALGIDNIANFEFFSPPPSKIVIESINQLYELGIIDDQNNLTKIGEICTEMPLDPRTSKSIIWASKNGCSEELISIAAMLSVKDVFLRPQKTSSSYKQSLMENARKKFAVREGDFMTLLNVFNSFKKRPKDSNWCRSLYLNHSALKRALKIRKQILRIAKKLNLKIASSCGEVEPILKAIINGFSRNAAKLQNDGSFKSVNSKETKLMLHPHSVLSGSAPGWVVFDEIISVDQNYMLNVSVLEPKWLIESKEMGFELNQREI